MKTILIASDHAGFEMKKKLVPYIESLGYKVRDMGAGHMDGTDDYPDIMVPVAYAISTDGVSQKAVILGGSGQGEAMVANRFPGVRAAVYYGGSLDIIKLSRQHNDSNILSLGARFLSEEEAMQAIALWLQTDFSHEERHARRIHKLDNIG